MTLQMSLGRRLLLQRLLKVPRPRLHLVEQAHVLDRNDGLIGEGLNKLDLPLSEWPGLRAAKGEEPSTFPSRTIGTPSSARKFPSLGPSP